eukprot:5157907-Amphidinium_carterae.2
MGCTPRRSGEQGIGAQTHRQTKTSEATSIDSSRKVVLDGFSRFSRVDSKYFAACDSLNVWGGTSRMDTSHDRRSIQTEAGASDAMAPLLVLAHGFFGGRDIPVLPTKAQEVPAPN